ncbi:hypothetical protein HWI79_2511 [Cryptosporidium felis]|nr:hypothetical protein HWI79_2511 [Cryptosporidium felis]
MRLLDTLTLVVLIWILGEAIETRTKYPENISNSVFPYSEQRNVFTQELILFTVDNGACLERAKRDVIEKFRQESGVKTVRIYRRIRVELRRADQVSYLRDTNLSRPLSGLYPMIVGEVSEKSLSYCVFRYVNIDGTGFILERKLPPDLVRSFDKELLENKTITFMIFKGVWYVYEGKGFYSPLRIGENMQHRGIFSYSGIGQSIHYVFVEEQHREKCIIDNLGSHRKKKSSGEENLENLRQEFIFRRSLLTPADKAGDERMDMDARQVVILREKIEYDLKMELIRYPEKKNVDCNVCVDIFQCPACNLEIFPSESEIEFNSIAIMQQRGFWLEDSVYPGKNLEIGGPFFDKMDIGVYSSHCTGKSDSPEELSRITDHKVNSYSEVGEPEDFGNGEFSEIQRGWEGIQKGLFQTEESEFSKKTPFFHGSAEIPRESVPKMNTPDRKLVINTSKFPKPRSKGFESSAGVFLEVPKASQEPSFPSDLTPPNSITDLSSKEPEFQEFKILEEFSQNETNDLNKRKLKSLPRDWIVRSSSSLLPGDQTLSTSTGTVESKFSDINEKSQSLSTTERSKLEGRSSSSSFSAFGEERSQSEFIKPIEGRLEQFSKHSERKMRAKKAGKIKRASRKFSRSNKSSPKTSEASLKSSHFNLKYLEPFSEPKRRGSEVRAPENSRSSFNKNRNKISRSREKRREGSLKKLRYKRYRNNIIENSGTERLMGKKDGTRGDSPIPIVRINYLNEEKKVGSLLRQEINRIFSQLIPWHAYGSEFIKEFNDEVFWPRGLRPRGMKNEFFSIGLEKIEPHDKRKSRARKMSKSN